MQRPGEEKMTTTPRFTGLSSSSAVASVVTTLVCAWFVAAGGAILSDRHSEHTIENARAHSVHVSAFETAAGLEVVATRSGATL
jgi:hypothetical protein